MKAVRIKYEGRDGNYHFSGLIKLEHSKMELEVYLHEYKEAEIVDFNEEY